MAVTPTHGLQISVETDTEWLVAGGTEGAVVTATVNENDGSLLEGVDVVFSCDPAMGSLSRTVAGTDENGRAVTTFFPGEKSGSVVISAEVYVDNRTEFADSPPLRVDHAAPYRLGEISCEHEVPVGSTTEIALTLEDTYGNIIDNGNFTENVIFYVGSPDDTAEFIVDGAPSKIANCSIDDRGMVTTNLKVAKTAGDNIVYLDLPGAMKDQYLSIKGIGEEMPYDLIVGVEPDDLSVPANGKDLFVITYTVRDRYGNPCNSTEIVINTSQEREEDRTIQTNQAGRATITYGPKDTVGKATITAKTILNVSLSDIQTVEFTNTSPVQMVLTASPQMMPSGDVPNAKPAQVMAKVMDAKGNPVEGELVTFTIKGLHGDCDKQDKSPRWERTIDDTTTAFTDERGYAIAPLWPGSFTGMGYPTARAGCIVGAVWRSYPEQTVDLEWTNVPYLSVITNVTPPKAAWNDTVEVNITLIGNGYKLQRKPVDVVLVMDKSGSMKDDDDDDTSRLDEAKTAAKSFVGQMDLDSGYDRVGLVTFSSDAILVQTLTGDDSKVIGKMNDMYAEGATNMRKGFYLAIKHLKESGRPDAMKAVILMSDGEWNYDGTPLAQGIGWKEEYRFSGNELEPDNYQYYDGLGGTLQEKGQWYLSRPFWDRPIRGAYNQDEKPTVEEVEELFPYYFSIEEEDIYWYAKCVFCTDGQFTNQNMSIYATSGDVPEQVRLYTIGFASDMSTVKPYLEVLSESTGGRYTWAKNETELKRVYADIAGELRVEAGVNTSLALDFTDVKVSTDTSEWRTVSGKDILNYLPETHEKMAWFNGSAVEGYPKIRNDAENWSNGRLEFDIGTIRLNQTWQTTFDLKVRPNSDAIGNVKLLDKNSVLTFNEAENLKIPDTFLTVMRSLNSTSLGDATLDLRDLKETGITRQALEIAWTLNYTGNSTVTEKVEYRSRYSSWATAETRTARKGETDERARLDIRDLPLTVYDIRVIADTEDAGSRHLTMQVDLSTLLNSKSYIKIE